MILFSIKQELIGSVDEAEIDILWPNMNEWDQLASKVSA